MSSPWVLTVSIIYLYESICGIDASVFENVNIIYFLAINAPLTKSRQCKTGAVSTGYLTTECGFCRPWCANTMHVTYFFHT